MPVKYTRDMLIEAARRTQTYDEAVRWCGGDPTPASRRHLRDRMAEEGVDTSHFVVSRARHTEAELRRLVACSKSVAEVVRRLGINPVGGNHTHISRRIKALGIDTSHFEQAPRRAGDARGDRLTLGSPSDGRVPGDRLRSALLRRGVVEQCAMCHNSGEWNGRTLRFEVDHVNGDWWDNRPPNLRLLCPNCHAVTDTYRGRKRRKGPN